MCCKSPCEQYVDGENWPLWVAIKECYQLCVRRTESRTVPPRLCWLSGNVISYVSKELQVVRCHQDCPWLSGWLSAMCRKDWKQDSATKIVLATSETLLKVVAFWKVKNGKMHGNLYRMNLVVSEGLQYSSHGSPDLIGAWGPFDLKPALCQGWLSSKCQKNWKQACATRSIPGYQGWLSAKYRKDWKQDSALRIVPGCHRWLSSTYQKNWKQNCATWIVPGC